MARQKMTSRERVLASINHQEPGRASVDPGAPPSPDISTIDYHNLKEYLGLNFGHTRVYDVVQELAQPEDEIIELFHVDAIDIGRAFNTEDSDWDDFQLSDGSMVQHPAWFHPERKPNGTLLANAPDGTLIAKRPAMATFYDQTYFPYIDGYPDDFSSLPQEIPKALWAGLVHSSWDHASEPDFWEQLRAQALYLRENTDKALMMVVRCNLFEWEAFLRRLDNFLMDLLSQPDNEERLLDALVEIHLNTLQKVCNSVGDVVDLVRFGDDLGAGYGPFMEQKIYRKLFKSRHKIMLDYVKEHNRMHAYLHPCGSIHSVIPDLIEAGSEALNPVQINSRDMEPERPKREFGQDVTFWDGGANTRDVPNKATPEEVTDHVTELLEIFMPGGGYVFNTVHNILPDAPPESIVAMFEAVEEYSNRMEAAS